MNNERSSSTTPLQLETLKWQFRLTWQLADYHLPRLTDDMCLWEPAAGSWSVRKARDDKWYPDWVEPEPDPAPTVTIGWLTWHIIWWWSGLLAKIREEAPLPRQEITWPGNASAVVMKLQELSEEWTEALNKLSSNDLERPFGYPWSEERPMRVALAWANSELMKNIAEIGIIRHLYEATHARD